MVNKICGKFWLKFWALDQCSEFCCLLIIMDGDDNSIWMTETPLIWYQWIPLGDQNAIMTKHLVVLCQSEELGAISTFLRFWALEQCSWSKIEVITSSCFFSTKLAVMVML